MDSVAPTLPLSGGYLLHTLGIILINIALSVDNSVVMGMAVHGLPRPLRRRGILLGTLGTVLLRVFLTLAASHLLAIPFLKLFGGMVILWIAVKLLLEEGTPAEARPPAASVRHAVWIIVVADAGMSIDNVLAVAGASRGDPLQIGIALGLSIPLVVAAGAALSRLMDRFPIILVIGAALLGKVGGEMIITDSGVQNWFRLEGSDPIRWGAQTLTTVGVLAAAWSIRRRRKQARPPTGAASGAAAREAPPS